jgi:hypothetical protein
VQPRRLEPSFSSRSPFPHDISATQSEFIAIMSYSTRKISRWSNMPELRGTLQSHQGGIFGWNITWTAREKLPSFCLGPVCSRMKSRMPRFSVGSARLDPSPVCYLRLSGRSLSRRDEGAITDKRRSSLRVALGRPYHHGIDGVDQRRSE